MTSELTGDDLDAIQQRTEAFGSRGLYGYVINGIEYQGDWVHDIHRLLGEVDRLRVLAEEHRQSARHSHYDVEALLLERERMEGEAARLRAENTDQAGQIAAATELRKAWDILPEELDRAASDTHRRVLQQIRGCGALLAAALGLVQDREGQADA